MAVDTEQIMVDAKPDPSTLDTNKENGSGPAKTLRRACDCCRKRKVKCDGADPCTPCKKATIRCAYLQPPKKKGPKGLRSARVLHALRTIDDRANDVPHQTVGPHNGAFGNWGWSNPTTSSATAMHPDAAYGPPTSVPPDQHY
jgi:hypothetical protein